MDICVLKHTHIQKLRDQPTIRTHSNVFLTMHYTDRPIHGATTHTHTHTRNHPHVRTRYVNTIEKNI